MTPNRFAVVLVHSTYHAIRLEKLLQGKGILCKMIPVPRQLSSDCGVCVRILQSDMPAVGQVIEAIKMEIQNIVPI